MVSPDDYDQVLGVDEEPCSRRCSKHNDGPCRGSSPDRPRSGFDVAIEISRHLECGLEFIRLKALGRLTLLNGYEFGKALAVFGVIGKVHLRDDVI